MSKKLKAVLSFALALVLVLSLGVSAFADSSDAEKDKEKEPEIVQIAFNLGTMEACAVRMRELGYDDIRLDGVSYKADAEDGVIAINLGDLAASKLLRENTEKAKELGIDYANLYIRGGKVLVKDDTGLNSDQIAALKQAVAKLMGSVRIGVNIGDIFDLANGEKVKLRVQVCNFIYPPQKDDSIKVKVIDEKNAEKLVNFDKEENPISAKTPDKTTVYFYYDETEVYEETAASDADEGKRTFEKEIKPRGVGIPSSVGIAKDKNDKNTYYIQLEYSGSARDNVEELKDLTKTEDSNGFLKALKKLWNDTYGWAKTIFISTDKDGKNVVKTIDIKNATPNLGEILDGKTPAGYEKDDDGTLTPKNNAEVSYDKGDKAEVTVRDKVKVEEFEDGGDIDIGSPSTDTSGIVTLEDTDKKAAVVTDAAPEAAAESDCEHAWDDGADTKEATCTEAGVKTYTCTECGETRIEKIPAKGHVFANGVCSVCKAEEPKTVEEPKPEEPKTEEEPKADAPAVQPAPAESAAPVVTESSKGTPAPTVEEKTPDTVPTPTPVQPTPEPAPAPEQPPVEQPAGAGEGAAG